MKLKYLYIFIIGVIVFSSFFACNNKTNRKDKNISLNETITNDSLNLIEDSTKNNLFIDLELNEIEKKVDVFVEGKLFTSYKWDKKNVFKPVLHPINTAYGTAITRGFPLTPKPGERADHMHHVGNWFNYGNINGIDYWGNGHNGERIENGGEIIHVGIEKMISGKNEAVLVTNSKWVDNERNELLQEKTEYHFIASGKTLIIDRIVALTALKNEIIFKDTKEGLFAIRVARELELPIRERTTIINNRLKQKKWRKTSIKNITGNYKSSEGIG
jgi:hypothetical protein